VRVIAVDGTAVDVEWLECVHRRDEGSDVTIRTVGDKSGPYRTYERFTRLNVESPVNCSIVSPVSGSIV
jgi:hypothetical protein